MTDMYPLLNAKTNKIHKKIVVYYTHTDSEMYNFTLIDQEYINDNQQKTH